MTTMRTRERALLATRWLLAPFFLGLLVGLLALLVKAAGKATGAVPFTQ